MTEPKTLLITGVSSGLGRAFAAAALADGHRVIGTVRRPADAESFGTSERAFPLLLDVTDYAAVPEAVHTAEREAGPIDVLSTTPAMATKAFLKNRPSTTFSVSLRPTSSALSR